MKNKSHSFFVIFDHKIIPFSVKEKPNDSIINKIIKNIFHRLVTNGEIVSAIHLLALVDRRTRDISEATRRWVMTSFTLCWTRRPKERQCCYRGAARVSISSQVHRERARGILHPTPPSQSLSLTLTVYRRFPNRRRKSFQYFCH